MKKYLVAFLGLCATCAIASPNDRNSPEYKSAYACAIESIKEKASGPASYCVGNSRDPSKIEERAYKDAAKDFSAKSTVKNNDCTFSYAVWIADGSRADGFEEGPQKVTTLRQAARLSSGREIQFIDKEGKQISSEVVKGLIVKKGRDFQVSEEAKKTCSKKQIG